MDLLWRNFLDLRLSTVLNLSGKVQKQTRQGWDHEIFLIFKKEDAEYVFDWGTEGRNKRRRLPFSDITDIKLVPKYNGQYKVMLIMVCSDIIISIELVPKYSGQCHNGIHRKTEIKLFSQT